VLDERALLRSLQAALSAESQDAPDDLVVVDRGLRRRSSLYFVAAAGDPGVRRWVIKRPTPEAERLGMSPPMSAGEQHRALQRLHDFLVSRGGSVTAPRPVAVLPDLGALAMEYAPGQSLFELVRPGALRRPDELVSGVRSAGLALREMHAIEPSSAEQPDLRAVESSVRREASAALSQVGLPVDARWFARDASATALPGRKVLLHGAWAPENVLLDGDQVVCLDPELTVRGWAEQDLARFLLMLLDRPVFVLTDSLGRGRALRHELISAFLTTYYGREPVSPVLRPLLEREVALRWVVRHQDVLDRRPPLRRARTALLHRYFRAVLDEISGPAWTALAQGDGPPSPP
jgi:aminoglycoside phosphotransferase (APT) family kinase protein